LSEETIKLRIFTEKYFFHFICYELPLTFEKKLDFVSLDDSTSFSSAKSLRESRVRADKMHPVGLHSSRVIGNLQNLTIRAIELLDGKTTSSIRVVKGTVGGVVGSSFMESNGGPDIGLVGARGVNKVVVEIIAGRDLTNELNLGKREGSRGNVLPGNEGRVGNRASRNSVPGNGKTILRGADKGISKGIAVAGEVVGQAREHDAVLNGNILSLDDKGPPGRLGTNGGVSLHLETELGVGDLVGIRVVVLGLFRKGRIDAVEEPERRRGNRGDVPGKVVSSRASSNGGKTEVSSGNAVVSSGSLLIVTELLEPGRASVALGEADLEGVGDHSDLLEGSGRGVSNLGLNKLLGLDVKESVLGRRDTNSLSVDGRGKGGVILGETLVSGSLDSGELESESSGLVAIRKVGDANTLASESTLAIFVL
jgi:hypothetical protein